MSTEDGASPRVEPEASSLSWSVAMNELAGLRADLTALRGERDALQDTVADMVEREHYVAVCNLVVEAEAERDALRGERDKWPADFGILSSRIIEEIDAKEAAEAERNRWQSYHAGLACLLDGIREGLGFQRFGNTDLNPALSCPTDDDLPGHVVVLKAERDALRVARDQFIERCRDLRNASPNAFYQHVDAFCAAAEAPGRRDKETKE